MHGLFDGNPNEGGTHHSNPSRRLEQQEEMQQVERENARRREQAKKGFRL